MYRLSKILKIVAPKLTWSGRWQKPGKAPSRVSHRRMEEMCSGEREDGDLEKCRHSVQHSLRGWWEAGSRGHP